MHAEIAQSYFIIDPAAVSRMLGMSMIFRVKEQPTHESGTCRRNDAAPVGC